MEFKEELDKCVYSVYYMHINIKKSWSAVRTKSLTVRTKTEERGIEVAKKRTNITITQETHERILQYAYENHLQGGLSGAIEHIAWHVLKVKNTQVRGQSSLDLKEVK